MQFVLCFILLCSSSMAFGLCTIGAQVNLRKGPGSRYPITWTVKRNMPLAEVRRQGAWIEVKDVDGSRHWVYSRLVSQTAQCVVVRRKFANLRTGPGKKFPLAKLALADRYFAFEKVDSEEAWFKVKTGPFGFAWVHESLVWRALRVQQIGF